MLSETVNIRLASEDELRRLASFFHVTLLPGASYQVAVKGRLNRIVGFVCVVPPASPNAAAVFQWRVVSRYVDSELEGRLIGKAITQSIERGATILENSDMLEADSAADRLLARIGFEVVMADDVYEVELANAKGRVNRSPQRFMDRRAALAGASVVPPCEHTWSAAAELAIRHGLLSRRFANLSLNETPFEAGSAVLLVRGVVRGTILGIVHGRVAEVAAMVVDEEFRAGLRWANALLTHTYGHCVALLGVEIFRFRAHPKKSREIRNFARRCRGRITARQHARALNLSCDEAILAA